MEEWKNCAGDITKELQEAEKLMEDNVGEQRFSITVDCSEIYTLICC